jgi:hypothetical protein
MIYQSVFWSIYRDAWSFCSPRLWQSLRHNHIEQFQPIIVEANTQMMMRPSDSADTRSSIAFSSLKKEKEKPTNSSIALTVLFQRLLKIMHAKLSRLPSDGVIFVHRAPVAQVCGLLTSSHLHTSRNVVLHLSMLSAGCIILYGFCSLTLCTSYSSISLCSLVTILILQYLIDQHQHLTLLNNEPRETYYLHLVFFRLT